MQEYKQKHYDTTLGSIMNVLYAKVLAVVEIAVPVTTSLNRRVPVTPDQIIGSIVGPRVHSPVLYYSCTPLSRKESNLKPM